MTIGICDADVGECFCPSDTKYGLMPGGGDAARQRARPMNGVHPNTVRHTNPKDNISLG